MNKTFQDISKSGWSHEDYVINLFSALIRTKNEVFCSFIQCQKDEWESYTDITADEIIAKANEKYNSAYHKKKQKATMLMLLEKCMVSNTSTVSKT